LFCNAAVDGKRMLIHLENAKGGRDRYDMLSPRLATHLISGAPSPFDRLSLSVVPPE
jgi:hypothetical protein